MAELILVVLSECFCELFISRLSIRNLHYPSSILVDACPVFITTDDLTVLESSTMK